MNQAIHNIVILIVTLVLFVLFDVRAEAAIYKWKDENGKIHFTDDPNRVPEQFRQDKVKFRPLPQTNPELENSKPKKEEDEKAVPPPEEIKETPADEKSNELTEADIKAFELIVSFFEEDMPRYDVIFNRKLGEGNARKRKWRILRSAVIGTIPQKEALLEQISKAELPLIKEIVSFLEQVIVEDKKLDNALPQISDNYRRLINHLASRLKNQASSEEEFLKLIEEAQQVPDEADKN